MTNQDLYLPIELAKQITTIAERLGIKRDGVWCKDGDDYYLYPEEEWVETEFVCRCEDLEPGDLIKTYRKDKLEAMLPEWCFTVSRTYGIYSWSVEQRKIQKEVEVYTGKTVAFDEYGQFPLPVPYKSTQRGPTSLSALAELILLLEKEGLLCT